MTKVKQTPIPNTRDTAIYDPSVNNGVTAGLVLDQQGYVAARLRFDPTANAGNQAEFYEREQLYAATKGGDILVADYKGLTQNLKLPDYLALPEAKDVPDSVKKAAQDLYPSLRQGLDRTPDAVKDAAKQIAKDTGVKGKGEASGPKGPGQTPGNDTNVKDKGGRA